MQALRKVLSSKIHRATVTEADLDYEGSISIPDALLSASGIAAYEAVNVWDINNGSRFETYAIPETRSSNYICVNGAAARLVHPGDLIIISTFKYIQDDELDGYEPRIVFVDEKNQVTKIANNMSYADSK